MKIEIYFGVILLYIFCFLTTVYADTFLEPSSSINNISSYASISTPISSCSSNSCCKGRSSSASHSNVFDIAGLDSICRPTISGPTNANTNGGFLVYTDDNYLNCSVSSSASSSSEYTVSFWVKQNCSSTSDCVLDVAGKKIKLAGNQLLFDNTQVVHLTANTWNFVTLRKTSDRGTIFVNYTKTAVVNLPSQPVQLYINLSRINSGEMFALLDLRLYSTDLTNREIEQLYNGTSFLSTISPHSECRCPSSYPEIVDSDSQYSLLCKKDTGATTSRFQNYSIPQLVIDRDDTTFWRANSENVTIGLDLRQVFQIDRIEVVMRTTPCSVNIRLDSGLDKTFSNTRSIVWDNISGSIQNRSQYERVISQNILVQFSKFCDSGSPTSHDIAEIKVSGRCSCYGNADSCTYSSSGNTCSCTRNTGGQDCKTCVNKFYRQTDDFGCLNSCDCNMTGSSSEVCNEVGGQCMCMPGVEGRPCDACQRFHYNISSNAGCTKSGCHENGAIGCNNNVTCDQCECKNNVINANCDQCKPNHYGIDTQQNGCLSCDCYGAGSLSFSCNIASGQCDCKDNVNGRTCNTCKDEFYGLSAVLTLGCKACLCNKYSSSSQICDKNTGQCLCRDGIKNLQCEPVVNSVSPSFGPLAGGTRVTVKGHHLGQDLSSGGLSIFDSTSHTNKFDVISWTQTEIVFETKPSSSAKKISLIMKWDLPFKNSASGDLFKTVDFIYKTNPVVTGTVAMVSHRSGGCDITITGSSFDSVLRPQLKSHLSGNKVMVTECTVYSSALVCKSPNVTQQETSFRYGLVLDGLTMYDDLSNQYTNAMVTVVDDPIVARSAFDDYKMLFSDTITIQGSHLKAACHSNLKITIGHINCNIESANNDSIVCTPDIKFPGIDMEDTPVMTNLFTKCTVCVKLDRLLQSQLDPAKRKEIFGEKQAHLHRIMLEKLAYYRRRTVARRRPDRYLSLIVDCMDQTKTSIPHFKDKKGKDIATTTPLKTHVTAIISHGTNQKFAFTDYYQYKHDSNLTLNVLLKCLWEISKGKPLPPVLYLQADNCFRENKNRFVLSFLELLVHRKIFYEVEIGSFRESAGMITFIQFWKTFEFIGIAIGAGCLVVLVLVIVICCCCKRRRRSFAGTSTSKKKKLENGFDMPTTNSVQNLIAVEKEDVPRFTNRLYSQKEHLETALTYDDNDCSEDFLHKVESSVREKIQRSVSDRKHIFPDKVCTLKGTEIRIINGRFTKESPKSGKELTIKTNVRTLKELLEENKYPTWLNNGLLECMKFQDCFHDNIIGILGISVDQNRFYVMYPHSSRVFKEYLKDQKNDFTPIQLIELCIQVANGMSYICNENMVHKDLATRNCVVMSDGLIKISDAAFSWNLYPTEYMYDNVRQRYLPVRWMALESLKMGFYDISSDVWSFGVLIWEVMTLASYLPYHEKPSNDSIKAHIEDGYRLGMPTNISDDLYAVMVDCWQKDNVHRPTFDEIIDRLESLKNPESLYVNQAFDSSWWIDFTLSSSKSKYLPVDRHCISEFHDGAYREDMLLVTPLVFVQLHTL